MDRQIGRGTDPAPYDKSKIFGPLIASTVSNAKEETMRKKIYYRSHPEEYEELDGYEFDWTVATDMLQDAEMVDISTEADDYIRRFINGDEVPTDLAKSSFRNALACYVEMELFPEEHYGTKDKYWFPNANIREIVGKFVDMMIACIEIMPKGSIDSFVESIIDHHSYYRTAFACYPPDREVRRSLYFKFGNTHFGFFRTGEDLEGVDLIQEERSTDGKKLIRSGTMESFVIDKNGTFSPTSKRKQVTITVPGENGLDHSNSIIEEANSSGITRRKMEYMTDIVGDIEEIIRESTEVIDSTPGQYIKPHEAAHADFDF